MAMRRSAPVDADVADHRSRSAPVRCTLPSSAPAVLPPAGVLPPIKGRAGTAGTVAAPPSAARPPGATVQAVLSLQASAGNAATSGWLVIQRAPTGEGTFGERPNLDLQDSGPGVRLLQQRLTAVGNPVAVSGVLDQATHDAVVAFQSTRPALLPATGGVGPLTWAALDASFRPQPSPEGNFGSRPNIEKSNNGPGVLLLQKRLVHHGLSVPLTSNFGQATHAAVVAFQQARPPLLPATGGVGPLTWDALDAPFASLSPRITGVHLVDVQQLDNSPLNRRTGFGLLSTHELTIDPLGTDPNELLTREVVSEGAPPNPPFVDVSAVNGPQGENQGRLRFGDIHFLNRAALVELDKMAPGTWVRHQQYQYKSAPGARNPGQPEWVTCATYELTRAVVKGGDGKWHMLTSVTGAPPVDQIIT